MMMKVQARGMLIILSAAILLAGFQSAQAQTEIRDWNDLHDIRDNLAGSYVLMNDLDQDSPGYATYNTNEGWLPIGTVDTPFTGTFDGNGYTISGLTIDRDTGYNGLFGDAVDATVRNVGIVNANIRTSGAWNGVLFGRVTASTIQNVYSTGVLVQDDQANFHHGGLIGQIRGGRLIKSWSSVDITTIGRLMGGLIGTITSFDNSPAVVEETYATGDVTCLADDGDITLYRWVGGLVGQFGGSSIIRNSYATGTVTAYSQVGGLVGYHWRGSLIENSYSIGAVTGELQAGGLVGHRDPDQGEVIGIVTNSYWNSETGGVDDGVGFGKTEGVSAKTTAEMKEQGTYTDWDFQFVWAFDESVNDGYPIFLFQVPTSSETVPQLPQELVLNQNYPNPFNPSTIISYQVTEQQHVRLSVYDVTGRLIAVLVDQQQSPGDYQVNWDAGQLSSGVYIYRLEAAGQTLSRTMTFVK